MRLGLILLVMLQSLAFRSRLLCLRRPMRLSSDRTTGSFKKQLVDVFPSETHYKRALRGLKGVKADTSIRNIRNQTRKLAAQTLDELMKQLTVPITEILSIYKALFRQLHPFEATVAELTVVSRVKAGLPHLDDVLNDLRLLRAMTSRIGKEYAAKASNATSSIEAKEILTQGMAELEALYEHSPEAQSLAALVEIQKDLRRIPIVELDTPTVVLVGSPNVGKSSIVRAVSSGTPEVNDYPFTTRGVTIGHIVDASRGLRFQVMDTPGLLDRPEEERNEMEKLTFASLAHLPTAVIFVIDVSGLSGRLSTLEAQLNVRAYLKSRFPRRPWIDVVSKADLEMPPEVAAMMPSGYIPVSVQSGYNVDLLKDRIEELLYELREVLFQRAVLKAT